jgi:hypothetical protein
VPLPPLPAETGRGVTCCCEAGCCDAEKPGCSPDVADADRGVAGTSVSTLTPLNARG